MLCVCFSLLFLCALIFFNSTFDICVFVWIVWVLRFLLASICLFVVWISFEFANIVLLWLACGFLSSYVFLYACVKTLTLPYFHSLSIRGFLPLSTLFAKAKITFIASTIFPIELWISTAIVHACVSRLCFLYYEFYAPISIQHTVFSMFVFVLHHSLNWWLQSSPYSRATIVAKTSIHFKKTSVPFWNISYIYIYICFLSSFYGQFWGKQINTKQAKKRTIMVRVSVSMCCLSTLMAKTGWNKQTSQQKKICIYW